jgi:hypothetical protein
MIGLLNRSKKKRKRILKLKALNHRFWKLVSKVYLCKNIYLKGKIFTTCTKTNIHFWECMMSIPGQLVNCLEWQRLASSHMINSRMSLELCIQMIKLFSQIWNSSNCKMIWRSHWTLNNPIWEQTSVFQLVWKSADLDL